MLRDRALSFTPISPIGVSCASIPQANIVWNYVQCSEYRPGFLRDISGRNPGSLLNGRLLLWPKASTGFYKIEKTTLSVAVK